MVMALLSDRDKPNDHPCLLTFTTPLPLRNVVRVIMDIIGLANNITSVDFLNTHYIHDYQTLPRSEPFSSGYYQKVIAEDDSVYVVLTEFSDI